MKRPSYGVRRVVGEGFPQVCLALELEVYYGSLLLDLKAAKCTKIVHTYDFPYVLIFSYKPLKVHGKIKSLAQRATKKWEGWKRWESPTVGAYAPRNGLLHAHRRKLHRTEQT